MSPLFYRFISYKVMVYRDIDKQNISLINNMINVNITLAC